MTKRALIVWALIMVSCETPPPATQSGARKSAARTLTPVATSSVHPPAAVPPAPLPPPPSEATSPRRLQLHPPPAIVLEDAGVEPREAFRFGAHEQRLLVEYSVRLDEVGGRPARPSDAGSGKNVVLVDVRSMPAEEAGAGAVLLTWQLAQVNGVAVEFPYTGQGMSAYFDARGHGLSNPATIAAPDHMPEDLPRQLGLIDNCLRHAIVPFPEQPLGRGARWSLPLASEEDGIISAGQEVYRLLAIDAKQLVIEVSRNKTRKRQKPRAVEELVEGASDLQTGSWQHAKKLTLARGNPVAFGTTRAIVSQSFLARAGDELVPQQTSSTWDCKVRFGGKVPSRDDE